MAERQTYSDWLRHPQWQRKRLEAMALAEFACEACGDVETTLNVHHTYYERGHKPWEYPTESLRCLCEPCHEIAQAVQDSLKRQMGRLELGSIAEVLGFAIGQELISSGMSFDFRTLGIPLDAPGSELGQPDYFVDVVTGIAAAHRLSVSDVIDCIEGSVITGAALLEARKRRGEGGGS